MSVSQAEVDALRREGERLNLDNIQHVLETQAEIIAFMIAEARASGLDEDEALDRVELVARAAEIDREELVSARATLKALHYPAALTKLVTRLAAQAKPRRER